MARSYMPFETDPRPTLEELQELLSGEHIDLIFKPTEVRLTTQMKWKLKDIVKPGEFRELLKEEHATLEVTVKNVSETEHEACYIALGFDTPEKFELKQVEPVKIAKGQTGTAVFAPPKHWLPHKGPRWVLVLITLDKVEEEDLEYEFRHNYNEEERRRIRFSMHPMIVPGPELAEEE